MSDKSYSYNEEEYHSYYSDILDHFNDHYEIGDKVEFWKGDTVQCGHERFIEPYILIEDMQDRAHEEVGEFADGYLNEVTEKQLHELKQLVAGYLDKNLAKHSFFTVKNVEKVEGWWDGEDVQFTP